MPSNLYTNKIVLITGSRRGVGKLITAHFLDQGAVVIGFARGPASIDHDRYQHIQIDLEEPQAINSAFSAIRKTTASLDILINNAAVLTSQHAMIMPTSAAKAMVDTNFLAPFLISREAAKMMRKSRWGRIINIGSMAVSLEPVGDSIYAACKAGLEVMANVMAKELSSFGITCNTLALSAIESDMLKQLPRDTIDKIIASLPVPRYATSADITNVIDFFASEKSAYITAQTLYLGGVN